MIYEKRQTYGVGFRLTQKICIINVCYDNYNIILIRLVKGDGGFCTGDAF